jgi:hypothetical protein
LASRYKLWKITGLKYRKTNDGRNFLTERYNMAAQKFIWTVHNLRISGVEHSVFCLDEISIQNHSKKFIWKGLARKGDLEVSPGKGSKHIACYSGSAKQTSILKASGFFVHGYRQNTRLRPSFRNDR